MLLLLFSCQKVITLLRVALAPRACATFYLFWGYYGAIGYSDRPETKFMQMGVQSASLIAPFLLYM